MPITGIKPRTPPMMVIVPKEIIDCIAWKRTNLFSCSIRINTKSLTQPSTWHNNPATFSVNPVKSCPFVRTSLTLTYPEHLGATGWAYPLSCWLTIPHSCGPGILHFPLSSALNTIRLYSLTSFFGMNDRLSTTTMLIVSLELHSMTKC